MSQNKLFTVKTKMEKKDYRKFLYLATFRKTPVIIPMMLIISAMGGVFVAFDKEFNIMTFLIAWPIMIICALAAVCLKVELKNKNRIKTDKLGEFSSYQTINFYENYIITYNENVEGKMKVRYDQFYKVLESRKYIIFYYNANMASLIRKEDIEDKNKEDIIKLLKEKLGKTFKTI